MTKPQMTETELYDHCYERAIYYLDWLVSMTPQRSKEESNILEAYYLTGHAKHLHDRTSEFGTG